MSISIKSDLTIIKILVLGDLNIDVIFESIQLGQNKPANPEKVVGGVGVNASLAFKNENFIPIIHGKVGNDYYGKIIIDKLIREEVLSLIEIDDKKPTCLCNILYFSNNDYLRTIFYDNYNANDYDINALIKVISEINLNISDYIYLPLYLIPQVNYDLNYCYKYYSILKKSKAKHIIDIVPHKLYDFISIKEFCFIFNNAVFVIIGEYKTFMNLIDTDLVIGECDSPSDLEYLTISENFHSKYYVCRFGEGSISLQSVFFVDNNSNIIFIEKNINTGYTSLLNSSLKRGYGDILTAKTLKKIISFDKIKN